MDAHMAAPVQDEAQRRAEERLRELNLPLDFMSELIRDGTSVAFQKGESIFLPGSTADVLYWVVSGLVKVYCPAPDGSALLARVAGPGDFIGFIDVVDASGRRVQSLEAQTMTRTSIAIFTRDRVRTLLKTLSPERLVALMENVNSAWSAVASSWIAFLGLSFRRRLLSTLQNLALRFGARDARGILLTIELSHDDLAEMIASSRPMVTRLIAEFVEKGMLARQGRHYILVSSALNGKHAVGQGVR